jgi:hypothetical protein
VPHPNARLTLHGRRLLVDRVRSGRPVAHVADEMGISRTTAHKWVRRWRTEGDAGLHETVRAGPGTRRTAPPPTSRNRSVRCGASGNSAARIGPMLGIPASTVHRVLTRHGLNRLRWMDRPTGQVIRRYERARPGEPPQSSGCGFSTRAAVCEAALPVGGVPGLGAGVPAGRRAAIAVGRPPSSRARIGMYAASADAG